MQSYAFDFSFSFNHMYNRPSGVSCSCIPSVTLTKFCCRFSSRAIHFVPQFCYAADESRMVCHLSHLRLLIHVAGYFLVRSSWHIFISLDVIRKEHEQERTGMGKGCVIDAMMGNFSTANLSCEASFEEPYQNTMVHLVSRSTALVNQNPKSYFR